MLIFVFNPNLKDWWVMMKKTQAQWIPCLYQWWKTMGILDHKPTKIMWTKEVILRHRNVWNQENLVRILNFTQHLDYFEFRAEFSQLHVLMSQNKLFLYHDKRFMCILIQKGHSEPVVWLVTLENHFCDFTIHFSTTSGNFSHIPFNIAST